MRLAVLLLFVSFAWVGGVPAGKWKERRPEGKANRYPQFEDWEVPSKPLYQRHGKDGVWGIGAPNKDRVGEDDTMPRARWCVSNLCEMKKCERMTTEFKYMVSPKLEWTCVMAESKEKCMEKIFDGNADIMTADGEEIYTAGKKFALMPIVHTKEDHSNVPNYNSRFSKYEEADGSGLKHFTIALVKKTNLEVNSYQDMRQRKSCHPGVDMPATFKSPVCALIKEGVIPPIGNAYESAGEFFKESCVPGVQLDLFNPNMTNPENLCKLCKDHKSLDFCKTVSEKEPYYGFSGALKCLQESQGDVGFFHTHDVMMNYDTLSQEFDIVCQSTRLPLDWDNVVKKDCHITEEYPETVLVSTDKPKDWVEACTNALLDASKRLSSKGTKDGFSLFDSALYCPNDDASSEWGIKKMKYTDLIFKDWSGGLEKTPMKRMTYTTFLGSDTINKWKTCEQLEPKPRAFICVVGDEEMTKCKDMIGRFMTIQEVNKISWGCVQASSKRDCVESVDRGVADIVTLNATEMFVAGVDYNLSPFMGENYKDKKQWTDSITVGVMLKDSTDLPEDMHGWKICSTGVDKINAFLHPMGWLLANGTIPRGITPLRSIGDYFGESCVPGMKTLDIMKHPILQRTLDWETLLKDKDVKWEEWMENPLWREWKDKETGASDVYEPMYKMQDFESDKFQMLIGKMLTEDQRVHKYHTSEIHEVLMKAKTKFSWSSYRGLEDFYGTTVPEWHMISWVWNKPEDWEEKEWDKFLTWAESKWNQKENWRSYIMKWWTDEDWITFKKWMDSEYKDYAKSHRDMHQDIFIRLSLLCSRFQWLTAKWINLQWDNVDITHCRERLCKSCVGLRDDKCSMDSSVEEYYGYEGALKCLKQDSGDIAFMDAYKLEEAVAYNGYRREDFVLLCPDGSTVDYTGTESFEECHFGHVPSKALVTCNMHDGVWRWKVTKAILEAQKIDSAFDALCNGDCESFTPIPFVNQTYQVWLGPMFLRAMEGLVQPPVKRMEWVKRNGKMYTEEPPPCDDCEEDDDMCLENCWSELSPTEKGRLGLDKKKPWGSKYSERKSGKIKNKMDMMKLKKTIMLWKPKGGKMHPIMKWKHMGPRKFGEVMERMEPMRYGMGPTKYGMGLMKHGEEPMKYGMDSKMMWIKKYMGPKKYGMGHMGRMMDYMMKDTRDKMGHMTMSKDVFMKGKISRDPTMMMMKDNVMEHSMMKMRMVQKPTVETGPMIRRHQSLRGEFYTNVIFVRDGTCNSVVHDLTCFGEPLYLKARSGRIGKTTISVPMCPRPSIMKKTTAQFTCDTGASFMKTVMLPARCSYVPCTNGFWLPGWSKDKYWDSVNSYPGDYWGNKDWWSLDKHDLNDNWFVADRSKNQVDKSKLVDLPEGGQLRWRGQKWREIGGP